MEVSFQGQSTDDDYACNAVRGQEAGINQSWTDYYGLKKSVI